MVVKFLTKLVGCVKKKSTVYEIFRFFRFLIKKYYYFIVLTRPIGIFIANSLKKKSAGRCVTPAFSLIP